MKRIIALASLLLLLADGAALANPDYSEMHQAFTNYFVSLDAILNTLPSINSATGTVQVIDAWSKANEKLSVAGEHFAANYPEVYRLPTPPPEFVATFGKVMRVKTDYAAVPAGVGKLVNEFGSVPEVQESLKRFRKSLDKVALLGSPPKK